MQCVLLSSAFGIATLLIIYPALHIGLKIIGSIYLCWLGLEKQQPLLIND